jgi:glutathione synthase/RimK-type ligase-like ATP-grasp enzyme
VAKVIVIVDKIKDWSHFYPVDKLLTPIEYLLRWDEIHSSKGHSKEKIKIINLCKDYKYLGEGYYCSLLAEARGHSVIPSLRSINDLSENSSFNFSIDRLDLAIEKAFKSQAPTDRISITIYFGKTEKEQLREVAKVIFDLFPAPILHIDFKWDRQWVIHSIKLGNLGNMKDIEEDMFANAIDEYSNKIWRRPKERKIYRYDLAILYNPKEEFPPSNYKAIQNFINAGKDNDVQIELVEKKDLSRIAEFDALFIRETTSLQNHTYRFAKKAEAEGLICIDDSLSILKCTNKIYLHNLLSVNHIKSPKSCVISNQESQLQEAIDLIGFPMIVKIPDGSFSRGIYKVQRPEELLNVTSDLFKKTALILVQEYFYTEFDWRIGILNRTPIFACKYYMTDGHWQIYNHNQGRGSTSGRSETLPLKAVPGYILEEASRLADQIGDGLYGVDLKEKNNTAFIIEINDNPNIDSNIEDAVNGLMLYDKIIKEFIRRIEAK